MSEALWQANWPPGLPREPQYPLGQVPLTHYLRHWARVRPDETAVVFYGSLLTWRQLDQRSDALARWLTALGIEPGDRVAVFLPNCPQFHWVFYGLLKHGAIYVPISPLAKSFELHHELHDSGAVALVGLDTLMPLVQQVQADHPQLPLRQCIVTGYADVLTGELTLPAPEALRQPRQACPQALELMAGLQAHTQPEPLPLRDDADAIAALNYTGGTTGLPKGCMHTQRDMVYTAAANCGISIHLNPDTVFLTSFLQSWIAGENGGLIFHVFCGRPLVLLARWDPTTVLQAIARYRVTTLVMTVDSAIELMEHPAFAHTDLSSLQQPRVVSFMQKLSLPLRQRWRALHPTTLIESAWGMTETHTSNTFTTGLQTDDLDLRSQPVFIGLPVPGTRLQVCDFETGQTLGPELEGELCIQTPALFKGYWNRPEDTAASFRDGWFRTGDSGLIDAQGFIHYLGRKKEMIKVNGMSVFPMEIETVLGQHPDVLSVGVVARPDEKKGEMPVAYVCLRPGKDTDTCLPTLAPWLLARLSSYKLPELRCVPAMPCTASGKVDKKVLQTWLTEATV